MNPDNDSNSVPDDLKELIRLIVLNFYGFDFLLCIEYLMIYLCLRVQDLAEILKLDPKTVHEHLITLKKDKFLNEKLMVDIQNDGKHIKHHLFYVNYISAVNVIKYKIDKIRERFEKEQLKSTQTIYRCVSCSKVFTEFDLKEIFMTMKCQRCFGEVREEVHQFQNLLQIFNTKMSPVFNLLKKVDKIKLPMSVLRPVARIEQTVLKRPILSEQTNESKEQLEKKRVETFEPKNNEMSQTVPEKDLEKIVMNKLLKYEFRKIKIDDDQIVPSLDGATEEEAFPIIMVNGSSIRFDKITPEITDKMNELEKEAYIKVISDLYTQVYDNF